jgi:DNA polymerase/3'-5' exonuclease PolX
MQYELAYRLARDLANDLAPACERIEIAGGLRRRKPDVHDLELLAIPKLLTMPVSNLFGTDQVDYNPLDDYLADLVDMGRLEPGTKNGQRFKQFKVLPSGIFLDLFIVLPPAQWGVIKAIRTGPAHYSHWLVTRKDRGGALPNHLRVKDGALWPLYGGLALETPTEESFFEVLGIPMPDPVDRVPAWSSNGGGESDAV